MKVLFIINFYTTNAGASSALKQYILNNPLLEDPIVFCNWCDMRQEDTLPVHHSDAQTALDYYLNNGYQCIHYFRSDGWSLFEKMMRLANQRGLNIPVITTICQKPSYVRYMLRAYEIVSSRCLVFIDKAAYHDRLYSFIPENRKALNYFGRTKEGIKTVTEIAEAREKQHPVPVVGRASTLNKCPDDMFEVYDRLDNPKKIVIVGGKGDATHVKILKQAAARSSEYDVEITGYLPRAELYERIADMDIFLYHLRADAYSSLDGTLGTAMLMKKPCVYMGPPAPAERFEHGVNGYVAHTKDELVHYTNMLLHDAELRKKIGTKARETTMRDFVLERTIAKYNELYAQLLASPLPPAIRIPLSFRCYYLFHHSVPLFRERCRKKLSQIKAKITNALRALVHR